MSSNTCRSRKHMGKRKGKGDVEKKSGGSSSQGRKSLPMSMQNRTKSSTIRSTSNGNGSDVFLNSNSR